MFWKLWCCSHWRVTEEATAMCVRNIHGWIKHTPSLSPMYYAIRYRDAEIKHFPVTLTKRGCQNN